MSKIKIILPPYTERTKLGKLMVLNNETPAFTCPAYGKADGQAAAEKRNPTRDALKKFGDTPFGGYGFRVEKINITSYPPRTYGVDNIIRLLPLSGDAKKAMDNGRGGLLIHGGDLNAAGKLRPTNGCVRVSNADMKKLIQALNGATSGTCDIVQVSTSNPMMPTISALTEMMKDPDGATGGVGDLLEYLDEATGGEDEMIEYPEEEAGGENPKIE